MVFKQETNKIQDTYIKKSHANLPLSIAQESTAQFIMEMIEGSRIFIRWDILNFGPIKGHLRS